MREVSTPVVGFGTKTHGVDISELVFLSILVDGDCLIIGSSSMLSVAQMTRSVLCC